MQYLFRMQNLPRDLQSSPKSFVWFLLLHPRLPMLFLKSFIRKSPHLPLSTVEPSYRCIERRNDELFKEQTFCPLPSRTTFSLVLLQCCQRICQYGQQFIILFAPLHEHRYILISDSKSQIDIQQFTKPHQVSCLLAKKVRLKLALPQTLVRQLGHGMD